MAPMLVVGPPQGLFEVCPSRPGARHSAPVWRAGLARIAWRHRSRTQPMQRIRSAFSRRCPIAVCAGGFASRDPGLRR